MIVNSIIKYAIQSLTLYLGIKNFKNIEYFLNKYLLQVF